MKFEFLTRCKLKCIDVTCGKPKTYKRDQIVKTAWLDEVEARKFLTGSLLST